MIVQCYFSLEIEPVLDETTLAAMFSITAGNLFYPVGRHNAGRALHGALVDDSKIAPTFQTLAGLGKAPMVCGVFDIQGNPVEGFTYNKAERDSYFQPISYFDPELNETVQVIPSDTVASGWGIPQWN
jgi:hypothetical protein